MLASDCYMIPLVEKYMNNTMYLEDGQTEEQLIENYFNHKPHHNWVVDNGFLCVEDYKDYVIVVFAWYNKSYSAHKDMVNLGKYLYELYTVKQDKPMYYTGLTNFYRNHSVKISDNLWQFVVC